MTNLLLALAALLTLALYATSFRRVPEGEAWTVRRFGRYVRTLQPGRHAVWPLLDRIGRHVPLTGHHVELPARALGRDAGGADLYFQILDPLQTGERLDRVDEWVRDHADDALSSMTCDVRPQASHADPELADAIKDELNRRLGSKGLRVVRCELVAEA
ncbi:MAG: hypothetical protein JSR26_01000 [Proteobacteria bacterium]|nr:hypothetical protein [Pseudomonadota bacterium]